MKIAITIIIVAMVARAQGLRCSTCVDQTGLEVGVDYGEQCTTTSVIDCVDDMLVSDICLSIFITYMTKEYVDGKPVEGYANIFGCSTEQYVVEPEMCAEMTKNFKTEGLTDITCRVDLCGDDGCNYLYSKGREGERGNWKWGRELCVIRNSSGDIYLYRRNLLIPYLETITLYIFSRHSFLCIMSNL